MMKKFTGLLCSLLMIFGFAAIAGATPVNYLVGNGSSVNLTDNTASWILGYATITGTLNPSLAGLSGTINDGATAEFPFFDLTVNGRGLAAIGTYDITATFDLDLPSITQSGQGGGLFGSLIGTINGGTLSWTSYTLPDLITLEDGNQISIYFENGIAIGLGDTATVHAYIANRGAPVPEPATILLMSAGMFGLVAFGRKRLKMKG